MVEVRGLSEGEPAELGDRLDCNNSTDGFSKNYSASTIPGNWQNVGICRKVQK
jgi:hypothetical protein